MFRWEKLGRVFAPQEVDGPDWMQEFAQAPATLIFDDFVRVYFSCRPRPDPQGQYVSYSAFVDLDRKDLFKIRRLSEVPVLQLGDLGTFDEFGTYPFCAIRHGNEIWAYYGGWTRCQSIPFTVSIGAAISQDDGQTFVKMGPGPLLTQNVHDPFVLSGPKVRRFDNRWYLWYVAGTKWFEREGSIEAVYKIRMATSEDGLEWERQGYDLIENKIGEDECQASPDVFFHQGKYHMFFCYKHSFNFRNNDRGYRIGYAVSKDLLNWTRRDESVGIQVSEKGWDDQSVAYPHVFELDDEIYMLYLGNQVGRYGFGIARLAE